MDTVQYFGYGSLVNRNTRPETETFEVATLAGWRRAWGHAVQDERARDISGWPKLDQPALGYTVLTVEPLSNSRIDGVQVGIDAAELPSLDARERGYTRHSVCSAMSTDPIAIYVSNSAHVKRACSDYPLLQSYVDCVMAGYLTVFGWEGVGRFVQSTVGWSAPMLQDRSAPLYPRAVNLSKELLANFDERTQAAHIAEREAG